MSLSSKQQKGRMSTVPLQPKIIGASLYTLVTTEMSDALLTSNPTEDENFGTMSKIRILLIFFSRSWWVFGRWELGSLSGLLCFQKFNLRCHRPKLLRLHLDSEKLRREPLLLRRLAKVRRDTCLHLLSSHLSKKTTEKTFWLQLEHR